MATGRKFGWHSGVLTALDGRFKGDLYVQDDIVFSDVSAGILGITGGIDMSGTVSAIGIDMGGTFSTVAINIDGTCLGTTSGAIQVTLDYDFSANGVGENYPSAIRLDLTQTAVGTNMAGGFYGVHARLHAAYGNLGTYGIFSRCYVSATGSSQEINDVVAVMGEIRVNGADINRYAAESSISALRGSISNSSTGAFEGQVFGLMLDFGSAHNHGDETALIFGYSHGNVYLDYGLHFIYNSTTQALTKGIWLEAGTGTMTTGIDIGACTQLGINISMPVLTVGDSYSGVRVSVISAAPNNSYGTAAYFSTNLTGTQAGQFVYGIGSWININSFTAVAGRFLCAQDNGIYQGTDNGEINGATLIFGVRMECLLASSDALTYPFSINTSDDGITAIFESNGTDLGQVTDAGSDDGNLVPLFSRGGNTRYVKLYTLA